MTQTEILKKHKLYYTWNNMKGRCGTKAHPRYKSYGGRGIKVCKRWLLPRWKGFLNFIEDMGDRPYKHSLDRINNNKGYSPSNCRWASVEVQARNKRTTGGCVYYKTDTYRSKPYTAIVKTLEGKNKYLGYFKTKKEAEQKLAEVYDEYYAIGGEK